jgi:hypothetical protein
MDDVIGKLTPEQALIVVERLSRKGGKLRDAVVAEAMNVLTEIDATEIAEEVFDALDSIDVQECWNRSGRSRDGYTSPDEAAAELFDEALQPFVDQIERYRELGMLDQETTYCMGVIWGVYRYERESESEFKTWAVDIPGEAAGYLYDKWRKRARDKTRVEAMRAFIRAHCQEWADAMKARSTCCGGLAPPGAGEKASQGDRMRSRNRPKGTPTARQLAELIEEATVDCYNDEEQATGFLTKIEDNLALPFATRLLGVEVSVVGVDLDDDIVIKALCKHGRKRQRIPLTDLPLPSPAPAGAEWVAAYRHWMRGRAGESGDGA